MYTKTNRYGYSLVILLFLAALTGCGGGGSSSGSTSTAGTGTVGLTLTDAPTDDLDAVNVTIVKAELLSDSGRVTIFQGKETVNLLDYRSDARFLSLAPNVPAGTYEKIRLTLSDIELVKCEDGAVIQPVDVDDVEQVAFRLRAQHHEPNHAGQHVDHTKRLHEANRCFLP